MRLIRTETYKVKDPEKLIRIAKEWGVETEGKDIYDLAHEMSELALLEYGKPFGNTEIPEDELRSIHRISGREQEIAPRAIDREVACSLHMTHMGCSSLPEALDSSVPYVPDFPMDGAAP